MTASVRKLALDYSYPWFWPFAISVAVISDFDFLHRPDYTGVFLGGLMLALQGTFSAPKVPLWRTLPVTDMEIGRARWWQMIGIPGLALLAAMALATVLHILVGPADWSRHFPDAPTILGGLLGQFFYPVLLTLFTLAMAFARTTRSPLAILATVVLGLAYLASLRLPLVLPDLSQEERALWLGLASLLTAAVLYVTTPRWPQPVVQPLQIDTGDRGSRAGGGRGPGQGGWIALCGLALLRPAVMVAAIVALWTATALALKLDRVFVLQLRFFLPFVIIVQITIFNATAMRVLRALPGSTFRLTAYLLLLPLALVAAVTCGFYLILEPGLTGDVARIDTVALAAILFASALVLPAAIAVRQIAMTLVLMLGMALVPLIEFGWDHVPPPWHDEQVLVGLAVVAIGIGFFGMRRQISRGSRVYHQQPFIPARWRGAD